MLVLIIFFIMLKYKRIEVVCIDLKLHSEAGLQLFEYLSHFVLKIFILGGIIHKMDNIVVLIINGNGSLSKSLCEHINFSWRLLTTHCI
jgi:hypothetical protein